MDTILIARVSSKDQEDKGYSLPSQVKLLEDYAARKGLNVVKKFIFPESASGKIERKLFAESETYRKSHSNVKALLFEKVDRATRNLKDAVKLNEWIDDDASRQIHFVKQSLVIHKNSKSNEKFQWDIHVVLARQYSNNLSEEVRKGLDEKADQGWYPGNTKRGYRCIGETSHRTWIIDSSPDSEALFICKAFELYDSGEHTTFTIGTALFKEGWKTKEGKRIGKTVIHDLLRDCFYCGEFTWKGKHYPDANHEPLIKKELFYRVRERMQRKNTGKYRKRSFLFQDLMKCGECGRSVVADERKGHHYYHCTRYGTACQQRKYTKEDDVEEQVLNILDDLRIEDTELLGWVREALKENHAQEFEYHTTIMKDLNAKYARTESRLSGLYDDKQDGKVTTEFYDMKFKQYTQEQEDILSAINRHRRANVRYLELGSNIFELAQVGRKAYEQKSSMEEKRSLLNFVFSDVQLINNKLIPNYKNGFQLIAVRAKSGNWLGRRDSNPRVPAPEAGALPLGYSPTMERSYQIALKSKYPARRSSRSEGGATPQDDRKYNLEVNSVGPA